jgi:hypothetical protein
MSSSPALVRYADMSVVGIITLDVLTLSASSAIGLQLTHHCGFMIVSTMSPDFLNCRRSF